MPITLRTTVIFWSDHYALNNALQTTAIDLSKKLTSFDIFGSKDHSCAVCTQQTNFSGKLYDNKTWKALLSKDTSDTAITRFATPTLWINVLLLTASGQMKTCCPIDNYFDDKQWTISFLFHKLNVHRGHQDECPLQQYDKAESSHLRQLRRTLQYVWNQRAISVWGIRLIMHPRTSSNVSSIQGPASVSSIRRFFLHNKPAVSTQSDAPFFIL